VSILIVAPVYAQDSHESTSNAEDWKVEQAEIIADREHWAKHGTNRPRRGSPSKTELMQELSRDRFPEEG